MTDKGVEGSLGFAVWSDDVDAVRKLLAEGHDVDIDQWGEGTKTPLMESLDEVEAFYDNDRQTVTALLLEHGADVQRKDEFGRTPLHYAAGAGAAAVEMLLAKAANVNAQDHEGTTPLHIAVDRGSVTAVEALVRAGADLDARDAHGKRPRDFLPAEPQSDDPEERAIRSLVADRAR